MGVDTGKQLHTVVLRFTGEDSWPVHIVHLEECREFSDLDGLMQQFQVQCCVIDAMPEIHATRDFAQRWAGDVYMNFFSEQQRGKVAWDSREYWCGRTEPRPWTRPGRWCGKPG